MQHRSAGECPKRVNVHYQYAVGVAIRNAHRPLKIWQIYDFIKVHMPAICTWKNNHFENAIRTNTTKCEFFRKIEKRPNPNGRPECTYEFSVGGERNWANKYPINSYDPEKYLLVPEIHEDLYNGKMGYPNERQVEAARIDFENERAPYREMSKKKEKKLTKAQLKKEKARREMEEERERQDEINRAIQGIEDDDQRHYNDYNYQPQILQNQNQEQYDDVAEDEYIPEDEDNELMPQLQRHEGYDNYAIRNERYHGAVVHQKHKQPKVQASKVKKVQNHKKAAPYAITNSRTKQKARRESRNDHSYVPTPVVEDEHYDPCDLENIEPGVFFPPTTGYFQNQAQNQVQNQATPQQSAYNPWAPSTSNMTPPHRLLPQKQVPFAPSPLSAPRMSQVPPHRLLPQGQYLSSSMPGHPLMQTTPPSLFLQGQYSLGASMSCAPLHMQTPYQNRLANVQSQFHNMHFVSNNGPSTSPGAQEKAPTNMNPKYELPDDFLATEENTEPKYLQL